MRAFFIFSTYAVLGGPRFLFPAFYIFALRLRSQVSLRSNIKAPKRREPSIRKVLFHCRRPSSCLEWMITIPWKPFFATNRATSFPVPLKMELSAYIECRSWSRKISLNSCWSNARNAASAFFAKTKDRLGHPLPEPRNAIFRVLDNKNRPVGIWNRSNNSSSLLEPPARATKNFLFAHGDGLPCRRIGTTAHRLDNATRGNYATGILSASIALRQMILWSSASTRLRSS